MSELDPLPNDLRTLFADERAAYPDDLAAQVRVQRRLETAILFGALGGAGALGATATAVAAKSGLLSTLSLEAAKHAKLWIALSLVTGVVLGESHARLSSEADAPAPTSASGRAPGPVASLAPAATVTASSSVGAPRENEPTIAVSSLPASQVPPSSVGAAPTPSAAQSDLVAEQGLIDTARAALSRGRGADALRAADDHARKFPRGRLAEEREMLGIQALLLTGKRGDAEARVRRFHEAYPRSLYGAAVDALLRSREDAGP